MAALYTVTTGAQTLTGSATRTLVRLASSSTVRLKVTQVTCGFNGTTAIEPVCVRLVRLTAGSPTATTATAVKYDTGDGGPSAGTKTWVTAGEETVTDIFDEWLVSPNGGLLVVQYPLGREPVAAVSTVMALQAVTGSSVTPNVRATLVFEE